MVRKFFFSEHTKIQILPAFEIHQNFEWNFCVVGRLRQWLSVRRENLYIAEQWTIIA